MRQTSSTGFVEELRPECRKWKGESYGCEENLQEVRMSSEPAL
jgi:hypothetical protein